MTGRQAHRALTLVFSLLMGAIGVALIAQALLSSSPISARLVLGVLFIAAGAGRLYIEARRQRGA